MKSLSELERYILALAEPNIKDAKELALMEEYEKICLEKGIEQRISQNGVEIAKNLLSLDVSIDR